MRLCSPFVKINTSIYYTLIVHKSQNILFLKTALYHKYKSEGTLKKHLFDNNYRV